MVLNLRHRLFSFGNKRCALNLLLLGIVGLCAGIWLSTIVITPSREAFDAFCLSKPSIILRLMILGFPLLACFVAIRFSLPLLEKLIVLLGFAGYGSSGFLLFLAYGS